MFILPRIPPLVPSIISSIVRECNNHATPEHTNSSANNSSPDRYAAEPVEGWNENMDDEVWVAFQRMKLQGMPQEAYTKMIQQEDGELSTNPRIEVADDRESNYTGPSLKKAGYSTVPVKGYNQGFTLSGPNADLLLKRRVYFTVFSAIYCYDKNRIICRVGEGYFYHQVTTLTSNPPALQVPFDIGGIVHCFDEYGVLWYTMGDLWLQETTYTQLDHALTEVVNCIEANNLSITADPIYSPSNGDPGPSTSSGSGTHGTNMDVSRDEGLRALSASPDQEEIDNWMGKMKRHRAMQVKEGIRLSPVQCPVSTCGKVQRRPQALRDHLYFHFSIKPYRCDYGCDIGFETEANKNQHLETCPIYWAGRYH